MEEKEENKKGEEDELALHVLAVDDSLVDRILLHRLLSFSSFHVTCLESGNKALEYLGLADNSPSHHIDVDHHHLDDHNNYHVPDDNDDDDAILQSLPSSHHLGQKAKVNLIMTDYSMPGISGYDLLRRVKGSSLKDVPVIVMSSENVPSRINKCLEGGAEEFLIKPVRLSDLKRLKPFQQKE